MACDLSFFPEGSRIPVPVVAPPTYFLKHEKQGFLACLNIMKFIKSLARFFCQLFWLLRHAWKRQIGTGNIWLKGIMRIEGGKGLDRDYQFLPFWHFNFFDSEATWYKNNNNMLIQWRQSGALDFIQINVALKQAKKGMKWSQSFMIWAWKNSRIPKDFCYFEDTLHFHNTYF